MTVPAHPVNQPVAPLLAAHGAARVFSNGRGLLGIDLQVCAGEFVALLGPSGSGKSTLLRLLAGLDRATAGEILLLGAPRRPSHRSDTSVALVFQRPHLVGRISAVENVLGGRLGHAPRWRAMLRQFTQTDWTVAFEALEKVGLLRHAHDRTDRLSGGEQQRVAIARALAQQPRLLLADEPVSSLDPDNARAVLRVLRECSYAGIAVVCSLHQPELAVAFADRTVSMDAGRAERTVASVDGLPRGTLDHAVLAG